MTTLHDRLAELADEAPVALPAPGLWERGRRYRRVRRTGTAAIVVAACLALVVLSGLTWLRSVPPSRPAPAGAPVGLPDRIWQPSPWLPGTDDAGPLGQLVAAVSAERGGWLGKEPGLVGISASTGEYRFLDLPDAVHAPSSSVVPAVSPDGRHVAYWLTGSTDGSANTGGGSPVVGVATYDTATGDVRRHVIPTEHGLGPEVLVWADDSTLVFSAGQIVGGPEDSEMDQGSVRSGVLSAWRLDAASPDALRVGSFDGYDVESAGHGRVLLNDDGGHHVLTLDDPESMRRFVITRETSSQPVLDAAGKRVAVVFGGSREPGVSGLNPNAVLAGPLAARGPRQPEVAELEKVPHSGPTSRVVAWMDDTDVAVVRLVRRPVKDSFLLYRLSVTTGAGQQLVRLPDYGFGSTTQFATDLLNAPSVHAEKPQSPLDPRVVAGLALATAGVTLWALVRWRRRVQP